MSSVMGDKLKAPPKWDATDPVTTLVNEAGEEVGGIFPLESIADRRMHTVTQAGHCCVTWNWVPAPEEAEAYRAAGMGSSNPFGCFGVEAGTRLFTIRDKDGWSQGIIVSFRPDKLPAQGTYAGGQTVDRRARDIGGSALVATHIQGGYAAYGSTAKVDNPVELAKTWWYAQPIVEA